MELMGWLESTALAVWTRESPSIWAYPTILTLHTLGLAIVVGANVVVDARLLGWAPRLPMASLAQFFRVMWWAFALNAVTGLLLFVSEATRRATQPVFYAKLGLIAFALWSSTLTRSVVVRHAVHAAPDADPSHGWRLAAASLLLWISAIAAGRLMAYL